MPTTQPFKTLLMAIARYKKLMNRTIAILIAFLCFGCNNELVEESLEATCDGGTFVGYVSLLSQQEVNDFAAMCYSKIDGGLNIGYWLNSENDITDLSGLSTITEIYTSNYEVEFGHWGLLSVSAGNLTSLDGLQNIRSVGWLRLIGNNGLTDFTGLNSLEAIAAPRTRLFIWSNPNLESFNGLENLKTIGDQDGFSEISIHGNHSLQNIDALSGLNEVYGDLDFGRLCGDVATWYCYNMNLNDYCGLQNLFTNGIYGNFQTSSGPDGNNFTPTIQDIIDGNCAQ